MKKKLTIIGVVLLNFGMLILSLLIHYRKTFPIIRKTDAPSSIETLFYIPILVIGIVIFLMNKKFRRFGLGLIALCISSAMFIVFYLNSSLATEGDFKNFKLQEAIQSGDDFYLKIKFNSQYTLIEVSQEKCLKIDSVQVQIDDGLFGMPKVTNNVRLVEKSNCDHEAVDSANLLKSHLKIGHDLAVRRCFSGAIDHYSTCIELDSFVIAGHYNRGLMYLAVEDYDKALVDFFNSAAIKYDQLDHKSIQDIENFDYLSSSKEILEKVKNEDFNEMSELLKNIITIHDLYDYQNRIIFCLEKINSKEPVEHR